jgi:hypothetical protein
MTEDDVLRATVSAMCWCVNCGDAGMCAGASNNNAPSCYEQAYKALAAYRLSTLAPLREAMNLKPDLAEVDVIKAAKTLRHIYDQVLYTSSSHPFICGTIGDIGHNGLHDGYIICPAYGVDAQCSEVFVRQSAGTQLSDN